VIRLLEVDYCVSNSGNFKELSGMGTSGNGQALFPGFWKVIGIEK
jgi:hypothetical protein